MNARSRSAVVAAVSVVGAGVLVVGAFLSASASGGTEAASEGIAAESSPAPDVPKSELPANINPTKTPITDPPSSSPKPPPSDEQAQAETLEFIKHHEDEQGLVICLNDKEILVGTIESDHPDPDRTLTPEVKDESCAVTFEGSHAA